MIALQRQQKEPLEKCSPNVLPCRIHYDGPSKVTKRFWSPSLETDKTRTAYFRGRKLRGRPMNLPEGYEGIVASSTGQVLCSEPAKPRVAVPEESDSDGLGDEEAAEPVKVLDALATFDEITVWGHDQVPATDDPFVKGIEEWISFAEAIHSPPTAEKSFDVSSG